MYVVFQAGRLGPVGKSNNSVFGSIVQSPGVLIQALEFVTGKWKSKFVIHIIFNLKWGSLNNIEAF